MNQTSENSPPTRDRVETFGCRLNAFESEVIRAHLDDEGVRPRIIFNTCAVTAEAERQARQAIRKARRDHPEAEIVVTGCAAQIDPAGFAAMDEVDRVIGNEEKLRTETWRGDTGAEPRIMVNDIMGVTETAPHLVAGFEGRARAFVQVQQGCDHRCTFCIIPFGRGNSRSVAIGEVVRQARILVDNGYRELVLTGVDITSYGSDLPGSPSLGQLCRRLLALVPDLPRLRLSSIDPVEIDNDLLTLIADEPRLMPHLHLSVQAGDDLILKRMKRRHLRGDVIEIAQRLRDLRPDIVLGADFIAGFPTETEAMFQRSLDLVDEAGLMHLHVFPYSARSGTPAARMPQVPKADRKRRAAMLRAAGDAMLTRYIASRPGIRERVLIEQDCAGHTEHFIPMTVTGAIVGTVVDAVVTSAADGRLLGTLLTAEVAA
ncbi:MAG: tRNA (N(6)-L-threonylcarbamoyladenosine(37)-C(2))-methylthiotransferase MtaB [Proteobacteria bacterium]|nr:tRNA (N(6)-L-threonylcarbamoyladenosine(37)-C(2))-methylthiotransferase MtaB [Pseudomonadota bacterium]MDA1310534.1 tRNA (N(6)-L-threonylcarbamoyladenosine(37)-C(2))-methylthiotransferase MtaB [Pseudomonadota bacterium]